MSDLIRREDVIKLVNQFVVCLLSVLFKKIKIVGD